MSWFKKHILDEITRFFNRPNVVSFMKTLNALLGNPFVQAAVNGFLEENKDKLGNLTPAEIEEVGAGALKAIGEMEADPTFLANATKDATLKELQSPDFKAKLIAEEELIPGFQSPEIATAFADYLINKAIAALTAPPA